MGSAFYSEAQIYPWVRTRRGLVMFVRDCDWVCHTRRRACQKTYPHLITECTIWPPDDEVFSNSC